MLHFCWAVGVVWRLGCGPPAVWKVGVLVGPLSHLGNVWDCGMAVGLHALLLRPFKSCT